MQFLTTFAFSDNIIMDEECQEELGRPISSLKVTELRDELTKRALIKTGNKKELIDRLRQHLLRHSSSKQPIEDSLAQQEEIIQESVQDVEESAQVESVIDYSSAEKPDLQTEAQHNQGLPEQPLSTDTIHEDVVDYSTAEEKELDQQELCTEVQPHSEPVTEEHEAKGKELDIASHEEEQTEIHEQKQEAEAPESQEVIQDPVLTSPENKTETGEVHKEASKPIHDSVPQVPIILKRGLSDLKDSSNSGKGEKRRKWSVKDEKSSNSSPSAALSGGISSQKLQELINLQQSVDTNPATSSTKDTTVTSASEPNEDSRQLSADNNLEHDKSNIDSSDENVTVLKDADQSKPEESNSEASKKAAPSEIQSVEKEPTNGLLIENLVRPFTIPQLKEVLGQFGPIDGEKFWTDKVKSKCCVMFESVEVAQQTRESLDGQNWPSSNPKKLIISYITLEEYTQHINADKLKRVEQPTETVVNGDSEQATKRMTNRLGDKSDNNDADITGPIKKRLGEKVAACEVNTKLGNLNQVSGDGSQSQELDDLFRKTRSKPPLFWLPLTDDQAEIRQKERLERRNKERERPIKARRSSPPRRHSPARRHSPRHRSPSRRSPARYRSSNQRRSPPRRGGRSPIRGSSPRRRSPKRLRSRSRSVSPRRSPGLIRRGTGPSRRSPEPARRSPGPNRRSPVLVRRSPGPIRRSPRPNRRSPGPIRRSPGQIRHSPGPLRRSPGPVRRSPGPIRRSPGPIRRSPVLIRRSPGPVRRSPNRRSPVQGGRSRSRSPQRRSPVIRRRTPQRKVSPLRYQRT